jgi:hypothetical protein
LNKYKVTIPTLLALALLATVIPALVHSTEVSTPFQNGLPKPAYVRLSTEIDTVSSPSPYSVVAVAFSLHFALNATLFLSVGTFVKPSQCCPGGYLEEFSVDNSASAAVCGGTTSQFTGVLVTVTCFTRASFAAGQHSVTLLVLNGAGTWTIESGPTTALLVTFD